MKSTSYRPAAIFAAAWTLTCCLPDVVARAEGPAVLPPPSAAASGAAGYPATSTPEPAIPLAAPTAGDLLPPAAVVSPAMDQPLLLEEPIDEGPVWYAYPIHWIGNLPWDTSLELGINGATGSNESFSLRTGGYIKRESEFAKIDISGFYNKASAGGIETQNNAQLDIRNDWKLDSSSPWTLFATGTVFYDEFQVWDIQVNANGGVGYQWLDEEWISLITRVGAGGSREIGGTMDTWVPEALFGVEYEQQISANQKMYAKVDYFPEFDGFKEYRLVTDVGWEVELSRPNNLSLKMSVIDRYDSTPTGRADPELLNYSVLLLWKL